MSGTTDVRKLMEKLRAAHGALNQALREYGTVGVTKQEPELIAAARKKFRSAYRRLFDEYLDPLDARFRIIHPDYVRQILLSHVRDMK